jgi:hypothetical protein
LATRKIPSRKNISGFKRKKPMQDLLMVAYTVVFFVVALAYVVACDRLR